MKKAQIVCLVLKPRLVGLYAQTNPLSYGGTPVIKLFKRKSRLPKN